MSSVFLEFEISECDLASFLYIYKCLARHRIPRTLSLSSNSVFLFLALQMRNRIAVYDFLSLVLFFKELTLFSLCLWSVALCWFILQSALVIFAVILTGESLLFENSNLAIEKILKVDLCVPLPCPILWACLLFYLFMYFQHFFTLWNLKMLQIHFVYLFPQSQNHVCQRTLVSLTGEWYQRPRSGHCVCIFQKCGCLKALLENRAMMYKNFSLFLYPSSCIHNKLHMSLLSCLIQMQYNVTWSSISPLLLCKCPLQQ